MAVLLSGIRNGDHNLRSHVQSLTVNIHLCLIVEKQIQTLDHILHADPLDETWLAWYLHELFMSEHVWMKINGKFLPCIIESEETIKFADDTKDDIYSVSFTARLSFCGSTKI